MTDDLSWLRAVHADRKLEGGGGGGVAIIHINSCSQTLKTIDFKESNRAEHG